MPDGIRKGKDMAKTIVDESDELIRKWTKQYKFDRSIITKVGTDKFRVNLYNLQGDIIQVSKLTESFYLSIESGVVQNRTL